MSVKMKQPREGEWAGFVPLGTFSVGICRGVSTLSRWAARCHRGRISASCGTCAGRAKGAQKATGVGSSILHTLCIYSACKRPPSLGRCRESSPRDSYLMCANVWRSASTHRAGASSFLFDFIHTSWFFWKIFRNVMAAMKTPQKERERRCE